MRASNHRLDILAQPRALFATIHDFSNSHFCQASAPLSPCLHFGFAVMASQLIAAHTALYGFYIHSYILNCSLNLLHHIGLH